MFHNASGQIEQIGKNGHGTLKQYLPITEASWFSASSLPEGLNTVQALKNLYIKKCIKRFYRRSSGKQFMTSN